MGLSKEDLDIRVPPNLDMKSIHNKVFLGGCIGGCDDWQEKWLELFGAHVGLKNKYQKVTVYNPRWDYEWTSTQQIEWEFERLRDSDVIVMWFGNGGMNRIVFYELGMWINSTGRKAVIGCDPEFDRKDDVVIQTKLARPDLPIYTSLNDVAFAVSELI